MENAPNLRDPGDPQPTQQPRPPSRVLLIVAGIAAILVVGVGIAAVAMVSSARSEAAAARDEARAAQEDAAAALEALDAGQQDADAAVAAAEAAAEAVRSEAEAAAADEAAAAEAQAASDDAERSNREAAVSNIEDSVLEMAEEHAADDLIDGPVLHASCSPVAGGSLDDLSESTTVFDCFVATEELDDGRARGIGYNATMNWDSGEYTYGIGDP